MKTREGIEAGHIGSSRVTPKRLVPVGAELYVDLRGWAIHADRKNGKVFFETTDYHTSTLVINKEALRELIEQLETDNSDTAEEYVDSRLLKLSIKTREEKGLDIEALQVNDVVQIETQNDFFRFRILDPINQTRIVQLSSSDPRFRGPFRAVVEGASKEKDLIKPGMISLDFGVRFRFLDGEYIDKCIATIAVTKIFVNGYPIALVQPKQQDGQGGEDVKAKR